MVANPERGEIEVELEGVPHVLTPSFDAQIAIEQQTGRSLEQLAQAAGDGSLQLHQAAIVVTECVKAHGRAIKDADLQGYNPRRVGEEIVITGRLRVTKRIELLLYLAITGGYDAQGNVRTPPTAKTPAGSPDTDA